MHEKRASGATGWPAMVGNGEGVVGVEGVFFSTGSALIGGVEVGEERRLRIGCG